MANLGLRPAKSQQNTAVSRVPNPKVLTVQAADKIIYIVVMGKSGTGKTSFINLVSNSTLRTSKGLESCTEVIELSEPFEIGGRWFQLIDTPGFDDSSKNDTEILQTIATFLGDEYSNGRKLTGVIYVHSISDVRMGAISRRNFVMFQKFCGPDALHNVALLTSRWDGVKLAVGEARERELMTKATFFKPAIDGGASMFRHDRTIDTARNVLKYFLNRKPVTLLIQKEMINEKKNLSQTQAGFELQREYLEELKAHEKSIDSLLKELEESKKDNDIETEGEIAAEVEELRRRSNYIEEQKRKLEVIQYSPKITSEPPKRPGQTRSTSNKGIQGEGMAPNTQAAKLKSPNANRGALFNTPVAGSDCERPQPTTGHWNSARLVSWMAGFTVAAVLLARRRA